MNFIALWLLKRRYKKKIKAIRRSNPAMTDDMALSSLLGNKMGSYKRRIILINTLSVILVVSMLLTLFFILSAFFGFISTFSGVSGNTILTILEPKKKEDVEEDPNNWKWEKGKNTNNGTSKGGLYPKDPQLRLRAELIEILEHSAESLQPITGTYVEPAWMLGTMYRETGSSFYSVINNGKVASLYKELVMTNPSCSKGGGCSYMRRGISHFVGGTVSGGKDQGDPATQLINTSKSDHDGDHAVGFVQFEIPYIYDSTSEFSRVYENTEPVTTSASAASSQVYTDSELGFIRPNVMYIPDQMYNGVYSMGHKPDRMTSSSYKSIVESSDFTSLSQYNQDCLKFIYGTSAYVRGHLRTSDDGLILQLIALIKSGAIENVDDLANEIADKYWSDSSIGSSGDEGPMIKHIKNKYGLSGGDYVTWHGVYSVCVGKIAYNNLTALIDAAEKEGDSDGGGSNGDSIVDLAKQYLGHPYIWGGHGELVTESLIQQKMRIPGYNTNYLGFQRSFIGAKDEGGRDYLAFDCSGFTEFIYRTYTGGTFIGQTTYDQIKYGQEVSLSDIQVGDIVLFGTRSSPYHVGMYIGNDEFIHASKTGDVVKISALSSKRDTCAIRRIVDGVK